MFIFNHNCVLDEKYNKNIMTAKQKFCDNFTGLMSFRVQNIHETRNAWQSL